MARLLFFLGLLPAALCTAFWLGLGVSRQLPPVVVSAVALMFTLVPVAGLWSLFGRSAWGAVAGIWGWPTLSLLLLPGFFPGEFPDALSTGLATLAAVGGPGWVKKAGDVGQHFTPMAAVAGTTPAPEANRITPVCAPTTALREDEVALPYEGQGHSLAIPVQMGTDEFAMLFDTGATVTTLDTATLRRLRIPVPNDAPEIKLRTANGERSARLVQVPEIWVGGMRVAPVTIGVCEECADERVAGLLGLNVSGLFLVTLDTVRKEVVLRAREGEPDRVVDVAMWLGLEAMATIFPDGRVEVEVTGTNRAPRAISYAEVGIRCGEDHFVGELRDLSPSSTGSTRVRLPRGVNCDGYSVSLEHARW